MAGLNTLRTKGGLFLTVIIGGALLAFILSLALEHGGMGGNDPTIGRINGTDISYSIYQNKYDASKAMLTLMRGQDYFSAEEQDAIHNVAWQELLNEYALLPGFETLGLGITEEERLEMIAGEHVSPVIRGAFTNPYTGQFNPEDVVAYLNQSSEAGSTAEQRWFYLMREMKLARMMEKYSALVAGGLFVNDLEVEQGVRAANTSFTGRWAGRKYSEVPDSTIRLTNSELKAYYAQNKELFKQGDSRTISYVVFDVLPTDDDRVKVAQEVELMAGEFARAEDPMIYARSKSRAAVDANYYAREALPAEVAAIAFGKDRTALYGPVLENDVYTMSRVADVRALPDSVGVSYIALPATETALIDSLMQVASRRGADFAALAAAYSQDPQTAQQGGSLGVMPYSAYPEPFTEAFEGASAGNVVRVDAGAAAYIVRIDRMDRPTLKAQIATVTYPVVASPATEKAVHAEASAFNLAAHGSEEKFNAAASEKALVPRVAMIRNGDRSIAGLEDSREVVRWAFGARKNDVSEIFTLGNSFVIAILTDSREAGYATLEQALAQVRLLLTNKKKYEALAAQIEGKSPEEVAELFGGEVGSFDNLRFSSFYIDGMGVDPRVIGAITAAEKSGEVSAPVEGMGGAYVFVVDEIASEDRQSPEKERVRLEAEAEGIAPQQVNQALFEESEVTDGRVRYF